MRDDIDDTAKFIWTIAHNMLSNYYRRNARQSIGIPLDEICDTLVDDGNYITGDIIGRETADRLRSEIAFLSKIQRRVVIAYYFENKKQNEIADELGIPVGTVKWHLFEAKKDLKKGMEIMRESSELKFNPIKFETIGFNGNPGKMMASNILRSSLSQNIVYSVWKEAKSISEIADDLGVSPVYVESEAEYLEENDFLVKKGGKYLCNILLEEKTNEIVRMKEDMYRKSAELIAPELYDAIVESGIIDSGNLWGGRFGVETLTDVSEKDKSFIMWALFPYAAALSGEHLMEQSISFDEAAPLRPDGGQFICTASVCSDGTNKSKLPGIMKSWNGPCWIENGELSGWQIDSEWSEKRIDEGYPDRTMRILSLIKTWSDGGILSEAEYAFLVEHGVIRITGEVNKEFRVSPKCVWLEGSDIKRELLAICDRIKEKHIAELEAIKAPVVKAELAALPKHLHKMKKYCQQFIFFSDGMFIWHCMKNLVDSGKLRLPTDDQKKSLTMLIINDGETE